VPPDDADAFTAAVLKLVDDASARQTMGAAARAYVERTASPSGVAQSYADLFEDVARRK
jgi:glycosyltransferase involved in cell wall biosynthesis